MTIPQPIRKKDSRWVLFLIAGGIGVACIFILEATLLSVFASGLPTLFRLAAVVVPAIVLLGFVLIVVMGNRIFPWRYSIFGPYELSPPPKDFRPQICLSPSPFDPHSITRFAVGTQGIELTFSYGMRAFLPADSISAIGPAAGRTFVVEHDCPEIEGPLVVSQEIGQAIIAGLGRVEPPK